MSEIPLWPFAVYFAAVIVVAAGMISVSYLLGQRHKEAETGEPYESGIRTTGPSHLRLSVKFYMVAMFFVIFDLESVFIFAWAVSIRQAGWIGYVGMLVFLGTLLAVLTYLWRLGALNWSTDGLRARAERRKKEAAHEMVDEQAG
jgi:NADH-quinone oxidoreductase subunit A